MIWNELDFNIRCLLAKPIVLNGIGSLNHLTIDEISNIGFDVYNNRLGLLCINNSDIISALKIEDFSRVIEPFEFIFQNCIHNEDFKRNVIEALTLFFRDKVVLDADMHSFFIGEDGVLHAGNYNFVIENLKIMNNIDINQVEVKNQAEKDIDQKLKELRAKYSNYRNSNVDIPTLISAVCAKHPSINLFNVGKLTIYQLMSQYTALNTIDNYFISIDSLIHGADKKDVDLTHWASKQKK